jgi:hypothetical protein
MSYDGYESKGLGQGYGPRIRVGLADFPNRDAMILDR